ncbi:MAG: DUF4145 domain-containing protein [Phycisphaerales bacterium]|nr:DUF4145 domain-containing protein [Phycisphaerales bacterium]
MSTSSSNFEYLDPYDPRVARLAAQAETYVHEDPEACLFKLRLMIETMARTLAKVRMSQYISADLGAILGMLEREGLLSRRDADRLHAIRRDGNAAVHGDPLPKPTAMRRLHDAHQVGAWYARMIKRGAKVKPPAFVPPSLEVSDDPNHHRAEQIEDELERVRRDTRDALLIFREDEDVDHITRRLRSELEGLDRVANEAGEPLLDAEFVSLVMAMDLEQVFEHPRFGLDSREAHARAEAQLSDVKKALEAREQKYLNERRGLA